MAFLDIIISRTEHEIAEEIKDLEFAKKFVPVEDAFGENNVVNIDAAIRALQDRGSYKMIAERR